MWTFDKLQDYLLKHNLIKDKNWLDNYLRPTFMKAYAHLGRMGESHFFKDHRVYDFLGVDFIMDKDLNVYFIEANYIPSITPSSEEKEDFMVDMFTDMYEITTAY